MASWMAIVAVAEAPGAMSETICGVEIVLP
jgi:hypothetical protein